MKRILSWIFAVLCYGMGVFLSIYVGGWIMLLKPLQLLINAVSTGECTFALFTLCVIKILLSATMAGLMWCIGYIGFNHFKGKNEPDWEALEEKFKS